MPSNPSFLEYSSEHLKHALAQAVFLAIERNDQKILPLHLLWALRQEKGSLASEILKKVKLEGKQILQDLASSTSQASKPPTKQSPKKNGMPSIGPEVRRVMEKATLAAVEHGHPYVGTEHLLLGLLLIQDPTIVACLEKRGVNLRDLSEHLTIVMKSISRFPEMHETTNPSAPLKHGPDAPSSQQSVLELFGTDWTSEHVSHDPLIGRERELDRVMQILCRKTKNNPLLLGDPGVGKTAIVEGLASRLASGDVPAQLQGKRLVALDLPRMLAGTMYRGEFEGRIKQVIEEVRQNPQIILFIDELHTVVGAGSSSGSLDAANMLKPALARGWIRCIGATTFEEYKQHIEHDSALERRFQPIDVHEPTAAEAISMLSGLTGTYEHFHRVEIDKTAIEAAVELSIRHVPERRLPDKAIDLIDETAARVSLRIGRSPEQTQRLDLERLLRQLAQKKKQAIQEERYDEAMSAHNEELVLRERLAALQANATQPTKTRIARSDVVEALALQLKIPKERLVPPVGTDTHRTRLATRLIGQPHVVDAVSRILTKAASELGQGRGPLGSCLLLGPNGVGKTTLTHAIAETLFQDEHALIRLDMSEYGEGFGVSKLLGAPAGYVGYREGSKLGDHMKRRPHSVIVFEGCEKAHPDVQQIVQHLLETGEMVDASGRKISFRNTFIVLTSQIGSDRLISGTIGFSANNQTLNARYAEEVLKDTREQLKPELLNRLDEILVLHPLSEDACHQLVERELFSLATRLKEKHERTLTWDKEAVDALTCVTRPGQPLNGRDLVQRVRVQVETPLITTLAEDHQVWHLSFEPTTKQLSLHPALPKTPSTKKTKRQKEGLQVLPLG